MYALIAVLLATCPMVTVKWTVPDEHRIENVHLVTSDITGVAVIKDYVVVAGVEHDQDILKVSLKNAPAAHFYVRHPKSDASSEAQNAADALEAAVQKCAAQPVPTPTPTPTPTPGAP